jgi:hypothetical protein
MAFEAPFLLPGMTGNAASETFPKKLGTASSGRSRSFSPGLYNQSLNGNY